LFFPMIQMEVNPRANKSVSIRKPDLPAPGGLTYK